MRTNRHSRAAFTLIELLVVISVISVLAALILPAIQAARAAGRRAQCANHLMQLGIAVQNYEAAHEVLPPGSINRVSPINNKPSGYHMSWVAQILPYLEQTNVYNRMNFLSGAYADENSTARAITLDTLLCPSDSGAGRSGPDEGRASSYAACHHHLEAAIATDNSGVFFLNSKVRLDDVLDGASNTIFLGEKRADPDLGWMSGTRATLRNTGTVVNGAALPSQSNPDPVGGYSSFHPGGANICFGDGSVRFIKGTIGPAVYQRLGNRQDGELVSKDAY
jgi:prepilin-type N-terminal cleavage/methylation domain-containing protein/prepilin-type processing-associated H-X9-DG protein